MKFDVVMGNPPYNFPKVNGKSSGNVIWPNFVEKGVRKYSKRYLAFVHPPLWRKPVDENSDVDVWKILKDVEFLNINGDKKGNEVFNASTSYDFYILDKENGDKTVVSDIENNIHLIDISNWPFLPNKNFEDILILIGKENTQEVIFDSSYHASRNFVQDKKDKKYKYPVVHSTAEESKTIKYSSKNDRGHFGIPKIIVGESGVGNPIIDLNGEFGMTQGAIGILFDSEKEAYEIASALKSKEFQEVLEACKWSGFRIDHRMFENFREDWYKIINNQT